MLRPRYREVSVLSLGVCSKHDKRTEILQLTEALPADQLSRNTRKLGVGPKNVRQRQERIPSVIRINLLETALSETLTSAHLAPQALAFRTLRVVVHGIL